MVGADPLVAMVELAGIRGWFVTVYLKSDGFYLRRRAARVVVSTWGTCGEAPSPVAVPPFKNPIHSRPHIPPG